MSTPVDYGDHPPSLPPGDLFWVENDFYTWGEEDFEIASTKIRNWKTALDIGAHCGATARRYSKHFETVHCFEPLFGSYLRTNLSGMGNIIYHDCAVSDYEGTINIYPWERNSGASCILEESNSREFTERKWTRAGERPDPVEVPCCSIDSFEFRNVGFIKIDTEGYLDPVISGMGVTLASNLDVVLQIEKGADPELNETFLHMLSEQGFEQFAARCQDVFYVRYESLVGGHPFPGG